MPIAIAAAVAALRVCRESRASANHGYDLPGAATVTGGLLALVYGFTKAGTDGWSSSTTHRPCSRRPRSLLVAFVVIEQRAAHPLLPLRVVLDRNRGGSFLASLLVGTAMLGTFLSLTYYFQGTLHYSALKTGLRLPALLARHHHRRHRWPAACCPASGHGPHGDGGLLMAAAGPGPLQHPRRALDLRLSVVLPAEIIVSLGMGLSFVAMSSTALVGVEPRGRRRGQRPGQRHPADRRLHGRRPHQHHRHHATVSYVAAHGDVGRPR